MIFDIKGETNLKRLDSFCVQCNYHCSIEPVTFDNGTFVSCNVYRINNGIQYSVHSEAFWFEGLNYQESQEVIAGMALENMNIASLETKESTEDITNRMANTLRDTVIDMVPDVKEMMERENMGELCSVLDDLVEKLEEK